MTALSDTESSVELRLQERVLLVHRFYAPDVTTYAQMLAMMAKQLHDDGFEVSVFTTQPSYNGVYDGPPLKKSRVEDGVLVRRVRTPGGRTSIGRGLGGVLFGLRLIAHVARHRSSYDTITVSTVPPVLMGLFGVTAARLANARLIYHCMDLYPEIALASGLAKPSFLTRLATRLDSFTIRQSAKTIVLSNDMRQTIADRGLALGNVAVQNNFVVEPADDQHAVVLPVALERGPNFRILFAGNLGRFQGLDVLLDGVATYLTTAAEPALELVLLGAGTETSNLRRRALDLGIDAHVVFVEHQPLATAMAAMRNCDLAIVSLGSDLIRAAYPSKTATYLETGCRILAIVEANSELAALIRDNDLGSLATPNDPDSIATAIEAERQRATDRSDGERANAVAQSEFGAASVLPLWASLVTAHDNS